MNVVHFLRSVLTGVKVTAVVLLVVATAAGQNLVVSAGGSFAGTGTIKVAGNINTSGASAAVSIPGTVQLIGTVNPQDIGVSGKALTFQDLQALGTKNKTMTVNVAATSSLSVNNGVGQTFDIGALQLTLGGTSTITSGTLNVSNSASEVVYNSGGANQVILGLAYGGKLTLANASAKNFAGATTVGGAFTHSGGNLTVDQNLGFSTTGGAVAIATITDVLATRTMTVGNAAANIAAITNNHGTITGVANGGAILVAGNVTNTSALNAGLGGLNVTGTLTNNAAGTLLAGTGPLTIGGLTTNDGTLTLGGAAANFNGALTNQTTGVITGGGGLATVTGAFNGNGTSTTTAGTGGVIFASTVALGGGTLTGGAGSAITLNGNFTMSSGTMSLTGTGALTVNADFATTGGSVSYAGTSTFSYTQAGAQNVYNTTYGNLTIGGSGVKSALNDLTVSGTGSGLTLANDLNLSTHTLTMSAAGTNVTGSNEVVGKVNRTHAFAAATPYAFNRSDVTVAIASGATPNITLGMFPNTDPTTGLGAKYVKRQYTLASAFSTAADFMTIQLHYTDAELIGSPTENKLGLYKLVGGTWSKLATSGGAYTRHNGGTPDTIQLTNVNEGLAGIAEIGLRPLDYVTIATGGWNVATTWGSTVDDIPGATDDATVKHKVTGLNGANRTVANLAIQGSGANTGELDVDANTFTATTIISDGTIAVSAGATLASGALTNNAGGTSAVNVSGTATLSGTVTNAGAFTVNGATGLVNVNAAAFNNAGTLTVNNAAGQLNLNTGGGAFDLTNAGSITNNGTITVQ
jgi:hypothetical protein